MQTTTVAMRTASKNYLPGQKQQPTSGSRSAPPFTSRGFFGGVLNAKREPGRELVTTQPSLPARPAVADANRDRPRTSSLPGRKDAIQREIIFKTQDRTFRNAWQAILNSLDGVTDVQRLIDLARLDTIDLVLRSDIAWYKVGLHGTTTQFIDYDTRSQTKLNKAIVNASERHEPLQDKITVEVNAVLPILDFWNRSTGTLAATLAHELSIHAARLVPVIEDLRQNDGWTDVNKWVFEDHAFDTKTHPHHDALKIGNTEQKQRAEYRRLVQNLMEYWRDRGDESNARAVHKDYFADLWEHTPGVTSSLLSFWGVTLSDDV